MSFHEKVQGCLFPLVSHLIYHDGIFGLNAIKSYLEIGVSDGFSLRLMLQEHSPREVVVCDTWGAESGGSNKGNHKHIAAMLKDENLIDIDKVTFLDGDSKKLIPEYFQEHPGKMFDLAFVDGDHSIMGMIADLNSVVDHAWIILVHDLRNPAHLDLKQAFYKFYEAIRERFMLMDDGEYLGILFRRELF